MKWNSPRGIALKIALLLAAIVAAIVFVIIITVTNKVIVTPIAAVLVIVLVVSYFFSLALIERFVYRKIKLIYRTIHNLKTGKESRKGFDSSTDVMEDANEAVKEWAKKQDEQIQLLRDRENYRREFIGNVSHELKTPIFNIQGYLLTLLEGGLEDETVNKKYLQRAEKGVDRLITIVEDLDTISRFEANRLELDIAKMDIVQLAKEVFESLEMKAKHSDITLQFKKEHDKPIWVMADEKRIRQVLVNLVLNSINYGNNGGKTEIRFYDMAENLLVEVSDNGIGIKEEFISRLFERFFRVDQSRSREKGGSGLGLAIVKHIIEAHKQTINVRSTEGVGSTFAFTLKKAK